MTPLIARPLRRLTAIVALSAALCTTGCIFGGGASREVTFATVRHGIDYRYEFDEAFAGPSPSGGYDLVMTSGFSPEENRTGKTVRPAKIGRTRQLMHVQVAWRPARGSRSDFPAATNSTIRYYVFTETPAGERSYISYSGAGFVTVNVSKEHSDFTIRDSTLRPQEISGTVRDPLGASRATGRVSAENNIPRVTQLLEELEQATSSLTTAPSAP